MMAEPITELDAFINLKNNMTMELALAKLNLRFMEQEEKRQALSGQIKPEFAQNITTWRNKVANVKSSIEIANEFISELIDKDKTPEKKLPS